METCEPCEQELLEPNIEKNVTCNAILTLLREFMAHDVEQGNEEARGASPVFVAR